MPNIVAVAWRAHENDGGIVLPREPSPLYRVAPCECGEPIVPVPGQEEKPLPLLWCPECEARHTIPATLPLWTIRGSNAPPEGRREKRP